ncbi:ribosome maturation factor RimM [Euzebya tangerina]|uniref:ribosome maturation factor RimM n=1 Tax=Euzebya tangerina TaxID=591198 RepID=UPI000E312EB8|nr:ribosome maturation factor RimM [Euzebya tangerina]
MSDVPADRVIVGVIGKPFGTSGEVYVFADADLDEGFDPGTVLDAAQAPTAQLTVRHSRHQGDRLVVAFDGVGTRGDAESLRGALLHRGRDEVTLVEDALWVADLVGRRVVDVTGAPVGVVDSVKDGHAHDLLVVSLDRGGHASIPMVTELVEWSVDPLVLHPIPGLIDDQWL